MTIHDAIRNMKEKLGMDDFVAVIGHNHPINDTIIVYWKNDEKHVSTSCIVDEWSGYKVLHIFNAELRLCVQE